jgi:hypothetical protein
MRTARVKYLPPCDFCRGALLGLNNPAPKALYDGPTKQGPWANMCQRHLESAGLPNNPLTTKLEVAA